MKALKKNLVVVGVILSIFILKSCAINPLAWSPAPISSFPQKTAMNDELANIDKIHLNGWVGPEDIIFDSVGNLYCGVHKSENDFSDGKILKIDQNGKVEVFFDAGSWVAGLHFDEKGNLIALSHKQGLISISPQKNVTILAEKDDKGGKFYIPNGIDTDNNENIYFTNTSSESPYTMKYGKKLILEMKPKGGLYKYDRLTQKVVTIIDGTFFGNGVVLSKDETFLLMVETSKYRVLKYWLKGVNTGKTEVFVDNLIGFPNGISIREDGTFWLGFTTKRNDALDKIHPKPGMKKLVYALPDWMQPKQEKFGMVMNISEEGKVLRILFDTTGNQLPEAGAVKESNGYLYIGGDNLPYIGRYKL